MKHAVRVLVVDGDPHSLHAVVRPLQAAGYEVLEAATALDAFRQARKNHPALIMLNAALPDGDGTVLCKRIKTESGLQDCVVALLSDGSAAGEPASAFDVGADETIIRPLSDRELLLRVQAMVQTKQTQDELRERVKELNCLYRIGAVVDRQDIPLDEILQSIAELIPSGWQYPEIAAARILLDEHEFTTAGFRETCWSQVCDFVVNGERLGCVQVYYLEKRPERNEGPFLHGERALLEAIASRLGKIVERKRLQESLRESQERFRAVVEGSVEGILVHRNTMPLFANPAYARIFGFDSVAQVLTLDSVIPLIAPYDRERLLGYHAARTRGESAPDQYEADAVRRDGSIITLHQMVTTISWSGQPAVLSAFVDVTERRRAERKLDEHARDLEARNQELDAFAHTVAHDLRDPLVLITGLADVIQEDYALMSKAEIEHYLLLISRTGWRMHNILDELLLLSEVRKIDVRTEPLDMGTLVVSAKSRLAHVIEQEQAEIACPVDWPRAMGYGPWIEEVWVNYLSNAIKYGGRPPRIELGATVQEANVRFWVRDNGPGIALEDQAVLFTPFTRLSQVRAKGHGLGLSVVRRIIAKLGGEVGLESRGVPGEGSVFYFVLPGCDRSKRGAESE
ncbi:MAG: PAS domain S-box protein [Anaerolineae bacterium]|nr:PAS domain S-box protein [Anaerolineae bacterium]